MTTAAQAGALLGSAYGGEIGGAWGSVAGGMLDQSMMGGPAAPSSAANRSITDLIFDNSGWTVSTGGSKASASKNDSGGLGVMSNPYTPWVALGIAAVVVIGWIKVSKR